MSAIHKTPSLEVLWSELQEKTDRKLLLQHCPEVIVRPPTQLIESMLIDNTALLYTSLRLIKNRAIHYQLPEAAFQVDQMFHDQLFLRFENPK